MPDENPILIYWRSELEVFNKNLLSLQEHINEEAIHDLRVAIKKLRSCFKLYSALIEKKHKKKIPAGIDSIFSILGKHRNIEMSKKLLLLLGGKNTASFKSDTRLSAISARPGRRIQSAINSAI